ncbi:TetR family transcriptional regulator [Weissella oryzae SG25]|uniref:TetR family transcriptional regulator n=1 Tax=Weissella oryzae (strain DSM 25784 / JCM 18191 / LMG 30913 / SG25) TaxID=1329250 RepID=A0A069CRZ3_WEIOS|nr:TetR/AcrR family transcriptional regulator [Weissella oryzae]GAK30184.1 TetR family transcriptional regulator [Weissella oryzae SG25]
MAKKETSKARLRHAAHRLFADQGYRETTVQQIAEAAGLTERTFFRQFKDKSDVLFAAHEEFIAALLKAITECKEEQSLVKVVSGYREIAKQVFDDTHTMTAARHEIIMADENLYERELLKANQVTQQIQAVLEPTYGIDDAAFASKLAGNIYQLAFDTWVKQTEPEKLSSLVWHYYQKYCDFKTRN